MILNQSSDRLPEIIYNLICDTFNGRIIRWLVDHDDWLRIISSHREWVQLGLGLSLSMDGTLNHIMDAWLFSGLKSINGSNDEEN